MFLLIDDMQHRIFWLYLEPYTFIFKGDKEAVVYNTLNSAYISCPYDDRKPVFKRIIDELSNPDNGYCVNIKEEELNNQQLFSWIKQICESFSGNLVLPQKDKPFIMKPACKVYNTSKRMEKEDSFSFGRNILVNLNEVSLYLPCDDTPVQKELLFPYYKQFLYDYSFPDGKMRKENYALLLTQLSTIHIGKLNILNTSHSTLTKELGSLFLHYPHKKCFYIDFSTSLAQIERMYIDKETTFVIYCTFDKDLSFIKKKIMELRGFPINWRFIVACREDLFKATILQEQENIDCTLIPYYDGTNITFFEDYIFNELDDIISDPIDKTAIFRRQLLNENFFGKLTITPSGETYANVNCQPIGNILNDSLAQLVYKEMTNPTAWFMIRSYGGCENCVNNQLCPSISNYELVTGIANMCYKHK